MVKLIVEGNLGADAEVKNENGRKFVSMSIADTTRRTDENGQVHEKTQWVSATINGDGGNLLQYLKKGARVHVIGDGEVRMYHSEKQRALVAGLKVFVREIELTGSTPEAVPRDLYDTDGIAHRISKYYHCPDTANATLYNKSGEMFTVDANGWVLPTNVQEKEQATVTNEDASEQAEKPAEQATEATDKQSQKKGKK